MPQRNNSASTVESSDAALHRRTQLAGFSIRRVTPAEHKLMLFAYTQGRLSFAADHRSSLKCRVLKRKVQQ